MGLYAAPAERCRFVSVPCPHKCPPVRYSGSPEIPGGSGARPGASWRLAALKPDRVRIQDDRVQVILPHMIKAMIISIVSGVGSIRLPTSSHSFAYKRNKIFGRAWLFLISKALIAAKIDFMLHET